MAAEKVKLARARDHTHIQKTQNKGVGNADGRLHLHLPLSVPSVPRSITAFSSARHTHRHHNSQLTSHIHIALIELSGVRRSGVSASEIAIMGHSWRSSSADYLLHCHGIVIRRTYHYALDAFDAAAATPRA